MFHGTGPSALAGQETRKRGMFTEPSEMAKRQATQNPTYLQAFHMFDADRSGSIDLNELNNVLQTIQANANCPMGSVAFSRPQQPVSFDTLVKLAAKFSPQGSGVIMQAQFAEMMLYIECVKQVFDEIDGDRSGDINVAELSRALHLSGFQVERHGQGMSAPSLQVAQTIGNAYDTDGSGTLGFDEFLSLRLEWDNYITAWHSCVSPGAHSIQPPQLLRLLQDVQQNLESAAKMAVLPGMQQYAGYDANVRHGIQYYQRPFSQTTCEMLIVRYSKGSLVVTFEEFCLMMEFIREQKVRFSQADLNQNGSLDINELVHVFQLSGIPVSPDQLQMLATRYDQDGSGTIEFDEFIQMMTEWTGMTSQVNQFQTQFTSYGQQRAGAAELQQAMGQIRTYYQTIGGVVPNVRPFSPYTCRQLIASYGVPMPGEQFASGVSYTEFQRIVMEVQMAQNHFAQSTMTGTGSINAGELSMALGRCGLPIDMATIQTMMASYDYDRSGSIEFDEFLQILMECRLYHSRIQQLNVPGIQQTQIMQMMYSMPRQLFSVM